MPLGYPGPAICDVCGKTTYKYVLHSRLGVAVCHECPLTNVRGEDITSHAMLWVDLT